MMLIYIYNVSIHTVKKNTKALVVTSKDISLEVNAERTKCMVMSRDQQAAKNHNIQIGNKSFEGVEQFRYLGTTLTNQNSVHEEINRRLKRGNACYHVMQHLSSPSLLPKNIKMKIYRTIIFPVVLCGLSLSHCGRNIACGYLRIGCCERYLDLRGMRGEDSIMRSYMNLYSSLSIIWVIKSNDVGAACSTYAYRRGA
jgi:hypothetical protein